MGVRFSRFYLLVLISIQLCLAQNTIDPRVSELSFGEILNLWGEDDGKLSEQYFDLYVSKAKREFDTLELAKAYIYRSWDLPKGERITSIDSSILIMSTMNKPDRNAKNILMFYVHYAKAAEFYENYSDENATQNLIKGFEFAKQIEDKKYRVIILHNISKIKAEFGQESEAISLQRKTLDFLKENQASVSNFDIVYLENITNYARCLLYAKKIDSASAYLEKAKELAIEQNTDIVLKEINGYNAIVDYYRGYFNKAKDSLLIYKSESSGGSRADKLFYLGMIEGKQDNVGMKRQYFQSFDSIMKSLKYPLLDNCNEVYRFLLKDAIDNDNKTLEKRYFHRLTYYDSLLLQTQQRLREITLEKFDLPLEKEEKQAFNNTISIKSKLLTTFYFVSAVLVLGLLGYYIKYRKTKKRLQHIMQHPVQVKIGLSSSDTKLDKNVTAEILKNLNQWEKRNEFLNSGINQEKLAKTLNTNSTYLSQAINAHKGLNFASYLKDLRITYAINDLKQNPQIVKSKSMIQIAEMYGFSSLAVFNKAVKAKIGVTPGIFFKQIIKNGIVP